MGRKWRPCPRRYALHFRHAGELAEHYAILGMAHMAGGYPLYYDAMNEKGLGMAGLNFVGNAAYAKPFPVRTTWPRLNSPLDFGPMRRYSGGPESSCQPESHRRFLRHRPARLGLHWMLSDGKETLVVESMADGCTSMTTLPGS